MSGDGQKPVMNVRFPPSLLANARVLAERDGMSISAWMRRLIEREIGRRDGKCPTCGHDVEAMDRIFGEGHGG